MTKAEIGSREWFEVYLDAFNNNDFDGFSAFYAPDVEFYGQAANLKGPAQVIEFYTMVMDRIDEHVALKTFVGSKTNIAIELVTTLKFSFDCFESRVAHTQKEIPKLLLSASFRRGPQP